MLVPTFLLNVTLFTKVLEKLPYSLKGTTLILHDGSDPFLTTAVVCNLAASRPIIISTLQNIPQPENPQQAEILVLMGRNISATVSHLRMWNLWSARKPVLVLTESSENVKPWLELLWLRTRAVYATVMVLTNPPTYHTWFPYKPNECSNVITITDLNENSIFPKKLQKNLQGCAIKVTFNRLVPIVFDLDKGLEPQILHDLMFKLNATTLVKALPPLQFVWITLDSNGQPANAVKYLWENEADIAFSNLYVSHNTYIFVDFLTMHTEDHMSFFVPSALPAHRATALFRMFGISIWISILIVLFSIYLTSLGIFYISSGQINRAFSYSIAINLNLPFPKPPTKSLRILAVFAYFYSQHTTTWYQSSVISFLTDVPRESSIRNIVELASSNLKIHYHPSLRRALSLFTEPIVMQLKDDKRAMFTEALSLNGVAEHNNAILGPKISFTMRLYTNDSYFDEFGYPLINILKPPLFAPRLCFYISKGHPLYDLLNKYTRWIVEAGLPGQYINMMRVNPRSVIRKSREIRPFQVENVEGAFYLLFLLLSVSIFVFVLEVVVTQFCTHKMSVQSNRRSRKSRNSSLRVRLGHLL